MSMINAHNPLTGIRLCRREPECMHALLRSVWWAFLIVTPLCLATVSMFGWWCASISSSDASVQTIASAPENKIVIDLRTVLAGMKTRTEHYNASLAKPLTVRDPAPTPARVGNPSGKTISPKSGDGLQVPVPSL